MKSAVITVRIAPTDAGFSVNDGCGTWSLAPTTGPQATSFGPGPGSWIVGVDVAPGRYEHTDAGIFGCEYSLVTDFGWERKRESTSGVVGDFRLQAEILGGVKGDGEKLRIEGAAGFIAHEGRTCGTWERIALPRPTPTP